MSVLDHFFEVLISKLVGEIFKHHRSVAANGGQGSSQLVRGDGKEFVFGAVDDFGLGNVLKNNGGADVFGVVAKSGNGV